MESTREANLRWKTVDLQRATGDRFVIGDRPLVVAAVHSPETLRAAAALRDDPGAAPDLLELRVDHFAANPAALDELAGNPPRPLVVTVRRADEGGGTPDFDDRTRARLYARFLPSATALDVEVRSLDALAETIAAAKRGGVQIIASSHDFQETPDPAWLRARVGLAVAAGADICKVAALTRRAGDLARLLDFLDEERRLPLAVMGMGPLGRASRPVLAAAGSVLNYGYLGATAQVPGQWQAASLRERIAELLG